MLDPAQPVAKVLEYFRIHSGLRSGRPHGPTARGYNAGARRIAAESVENGPSCGSPPVIIYATSPVAAPGGGIHIRKSWPLRALLEHLLAVHGIRRVAFTGGPALFRELVSASLLDDLHISWSPKIAGGGPAAPVTGPAESFLPHGVEFDLVKLKRSAGECAAHYQARS
jgi:riboflavin biosynthesis pyrimidine reductase